MSWKGYLTVLGSPSVMLSCNPQQCTTHSCLALPKVSIISAWRICFFVCLFFKHRNGLLHLHRHICDHIPRNHWPDTSVGLQEAKSAKEDRTSQSLRSSEARMQSALLLMELLEIIFTFLVWTPKSFPGLHLIGRYFITGCWFVQTVCSINTLKQLKKLYCLSLQSTNEETGNMKLQSVQKHSSLQKIKGKRGKKLNV